MRCVSFENGMPLTVLLTGFGPFPGAPFNPTGPLVAALARRRRPAFADIVRIAHVFRTSYAAVDRDLPELLARHRPDVLLMFGLAARTPFIRVETCARNTRSVLLADAEGRLKLQRFIVRGAAPALRGPAPFARMWAAARTTGFPVRLSRDAGRYLCNYVYWRALESRQGRPEVIAFIHVPKVRQGPRRSGGPRRATQRDLARAGEAILGAIVAALRTAPVARVKIRSETMDTSHQ
jgi:pyroglutamyl-peptidase